jgi:tRNA threonylcarbamoyladenosine biosynthesis protein TsaE
MLRAAGRESFRTRSPSETEALAARLSERLVGGDTLCLVGDLGSGKTCFTRGLATGLGAGARVRSPSFTVLNVYEGGRLTLYHMDFYRLDRPEDIHDAGVEEYVYGSGVSVIEWAERAPSLLEGCTVLVRFNQLGDTERSIEVEWRETGPGGRSS